MSGCNDAYLIISIKLKVLSTQKIHQEILHASYKIRKKCIPSKRSAMPRILCWLDQGMDGIPTCRRI